MRLSILKRTKQKQNRREIFGFDIETYDDNKEFLLASVYYDENNKWTFFSKQELIDFFKTRRFRNAYVFASNLQFDFNGLFYGTKEIMEFDFLYRSSDMMYAKSYLTGEGFSKKNANRGNIVFLDTWNYCKMSVEKMGKILTLPKLIKPSFLGKKPKNDYEWKEIIEYNMRDSEISKKYAKFLFDSFHDLGATPKITIAQTAMSLFKNKYLDDQYFRMKTDDMDDIFQAYYGGRVEVFKRGKIQECNYYDFNSLYPSVMIKSYPNPNFHRITRKNTNEYIMKYEGVSDVTIECPNELNIPILPYRTKEKLIFPTGTFRSWQTHVELRRAISIGYKLIEVHKTHYFKETCTPFKGYVIDLYNQRKAFKKEGNPMQEVVKLLLNSLYGKFGQKYRDKDNWQPFNQTKEELDRYEWFERIGNFIRIKRSFCEPSSFCIPIWAAYVTAYGRLKLYDALVDCDPTYCDTDSIVTKKKMLTSDELGDLKLEMTIENGIFLRAKMYSASGTSGDGKQCQLVKIKGIGRHLDFDEFDKFIEDPQIQYTKFIKFKEAIRRGFIPNEIITIMKTLSLEDDKRFWNGRFDKNILQTSTPLTLINGIESRKYKDMQSKAKDEFLKRLEEDNKKFINSDLFDIHSVGKDITPEEFIETEQYFDTFH